MSEPRESEADRPEDDEPLSLAPSEEKPPPAPATQEGSGEEGSTEEGSGEEGDPILLIPVDEEPSREIPALEPIPEEPAPDLPPLFPTPVSPFAEPEPPPEAVERRIEVPKEAPPREPPTLYPLDLPGLTVWLFGNVNALIWMGATVVLAVLLFIGFLLSSVVGAPGLVLFWTIGFFLVAAYPLDVLRSAVAGASGLPDWPDYGGEGLGRMNALGVLALLAACLLPGLLLCSLLGRYFGLPLLLAGWAVFPAVLLMYSASGSLRAANPLRIRDALLGSGWRFFLAIAPGLVVLVTRVIAGDALWAPFVLSLLFPAMIAAGLVMGTLARENEKVGRRLLAIARTSARKSSEGEEE